MTSTMTSEEVKAILPHRPPFLFIDKVLEVQSGPDPSSRVGRRAKAVKNVTVNEPFFEGHFPGRPIMPGVLLIEAMAQTGAVATFVQGDRPLSVVIAKILSARFRRPVVPGDSVVMDGTVIKERGAMLVIDCTAHVDGELVAETSIMAHVTFDEG